MLIAAHAKTSAVLTQRYFLWHLYLSHAYVNVMVQFGAAASALSVVIALTISLCAATLSWRLIERPFLTRKSQSAGA
jgi:peptidoglycan/LPS O-acetylase OafA/YrhL